MAYQHIVVATDLGENAAQLLQKGAELASALQAKLSLIYIDIHHTGYYAELGIGAYNYTDKNSPNGRRASWRRSKTSRRILLRRW